MVQSQISRGFLARLESLEGRNVLMIGGHGELAHAMAAALADRGANLLFAARKLEKCSELARDIAATFGVGAIAVQSDVSREEDVRAAVAACVEKLGSIDVLINNAGASWSGAPESIPLSGWSKILDVNLTGAFIAAREAARYMLPAGKGAMLFVSSTGGLTSFTPEMAEIVPYTTSKAALIHLVRDLAAQWAARGIRVNAIAPGQVRSGLTLTVPAERIEAMRNAIPMKRLADPEDIAGAVAFLVSDAAGYITGQTVVIDGGLTLT